MRKTLGSILLAVLAVVLIGYGISVITDKDDNEIIDGTVNDAYIAQPSSSDISQADTNETRENTQTTAAAKKITDYEYAYAGFEPAYANMDIADWRLTLVNRDYILPEDYEVQLAPAITSDPDGIQLDYRVAPYYNEMYLAAKADGIDLVPVSGYRSLTRQRNNFERKINKYLDEGYGKIEATQMAAKIILPPGTSEHNAGLAMDICSLEQSFENTAEFKWLSENAADYGFILRYAEDKQDVTKIIYEPWHWRYVGVEAAKAMKESGQCLEEYLGVAD